MRIELLKKGSFRTATWAGGTTTELFIHPETSDCGARDFEVRVSSATVEIEESVFSDFKGYVRHIAPLEGNIHLVHEGHGEVLLMPCEADTFDGAWCTRSYGKCVDFNLIHRGDWRGGISALKDGDVQDCSAHGFAGFYILSDDVALDVKHDGQVRHYVAGRGDFLLVWDAEGATCTVSAGGGARAGEALAVVAFASRTVMEHS